MKSLTFILLRLLLAMASLATGSSIIVKLNGGSKRGKILLLNQVKALPG